MKYFFLFFGLFLTSLSAKIEILNLGHNGSVRYISKGNQLHKIQRVSSLNEIMYTHEYLYDKNGQLFGERLCDAFENIFHSNKFKLIKKNYFSPSCENNAFTKYDQKGNITAVDEKKFTYDNNNRLIKVTTPHFSIEYDYDSSGKRISRTINGTIQYFVYLGTNELAILDNQNDIIELRIPGLSFHKGICRLIAIETPEAIFSPVLNAQGSCIKLINILSKEEIDLDIDSYGKGFNKTIPTSWVFSGKHYDIEAGLVYFGNRYYCPEIKSWLTPDPLNQTNNPYLFCLGNPSKYIDPDGLWAIAIPNKDVNCKPSFNFNLIERRKKGGIDPNLPTNPKKDKNWRAISHPEAKRFGHHKYKNQKTGEEIRLDKGDPQGTGHEAHDHFHRINPNTTGNYNEYLDQHGNPVPKGSNESHLYPPKWVWWE